MTRYKMIRKYMKITTLAAALVIASAMTVCGNGTAGVYADRDPASEKEHSADAYRENKMAENFVREFETLGGESVMGIYGSAHIGIDAMDYNTGSVPSMANQIHSSYQDALHTEDLRWVTKEIEPEQMETIAVAGKKYQAAYFGKEDLTGFRDYSYREFWRLEHAYDDFRNCPKTGDVLPYGNYPMLIETEQVFVVDYGKTDGSVTRMYFRSDGNDWEGFLTTEEIRVE